MLTYSRLRTTLTSACLFALIAPPAHADGSWKSFHNHGMTMSRPTGWDARLVDRGIEVVSPDHNAIAMVELGPGDQPGTAEAYARDWVASHATFLPQAQVAQVQRQSSKFGDQAWAVVHYRTSSGQPGTAWVVALVKPHISYAYVLAAPTKQLPAERETLVLALSSFGYDRSQAATSRGSATSASLSHLQFVPWTDAIEQAFTTRVPEGWKVSGGSHRFTAVDVRTSYYLGSPDRQVAMMHGDADLPTFVLLDQVNARLGKHEGDVTGQGSLFPGVFMHYLPATEFNQWYIAHNLSKRLQNVQAGPSRELPELAARLQSKAQASDFAKLGAHFHVTAAARTFTGTTPDGKSIAGLLSSWTRSNDGVWTACPTVCYFAPGTSAEACETIAMHLDEDETESPAWREKHVREVNQAMGEMRAEGQRKMKEAQQRYEQWARWSHQQTQDWFDKIKARSDAQVAQDDARQALVQGFIDEQDRRSARIYDYQDTLLNRENIVGEK